MFAEVSGNLPPEKQENKHMQLLMKSLCIIGALILLLSGIVALASPLVSLPFINTPTTYSHNDQNSVYTPGNSHKNPLEALFKDPFEHSSNRSPGHLPEHSLNHTSAGNTTDTNSRAIAESNNQDDDLISTNSIGTESRVSTHDDFKSDNINANSINTTNNDDITSTIPSSSETSCTHAGICDINSDDCAVDNNYKDYAFCNSISLSDASLVYNGKQQKLNEITMRDSTTQITYIYEPVSETGAELGEDELPLTVGEYVVFATCGSKCCDISSFDRQAIFTITPAPLTLTNIQVKNKEYDGTTAAEYEPDSEHNIKIEGYFGNDEVKISTIGTPYFLDAEIGCNKFITFTEFKLTGTHAKNYYLVHPDFITASIYKR